MLKQLLPLLLLVFSFGLYAQKHVYNVELFGEKIGSTVVERIDKGNGEVEYKLNSVTKVNILFTHKSSSLIFDVIYKNGKLYSSYCKNVKDDVTEIVNIAWNGVEYVVKKGEDVFQLNQSIDFSVILLYFTEPKGISNIFSERLGQFLNFKTTNSGAYESKLDNGVKNIYRYKNGILYELEMSKGASVFMRLVK